MALTIAKDFPSVERISRSVGMISGTIAFDASYPTGGEAATDITKYFKTTLRVLFDNTAGYVFTWDKTNSKILAYYADYDAVADGALIEVPNATDLSTVTGVSFIAIGLV